jgi:hypothetical protein
LLLRGDVYLIVKTIKQGPVTTPDLPDDCEFSMLFSSARPSDSHIYECRPAESFSWPRNAVHVAAPVADLITSAKRYPPALALTRTQVAKLPCRDGETLCRAVAGLLRYHLDRQPESPYMLVRALEEGPSLSSTSRKTVGQYYWVVGVVTGAESVHATWVNDYFDLFSCMAADFEVDVAALTRRFESWSYIPDEV